MSLAHRHVLEDYIVGFDGTPNPHHLTVLKRPAVFSVLARKGREDEVAEALKGLSGVSTRFCGPGEWLLVSEEVAAGHLARELAAFGEERLYAVDQSDGRVVLRLSGPNVRKILSRCLAVDLHPDAFAIGEAANTLCCHVSANLARTGDNAFELVLPRSHAGHVFDEIMEMGREFALTASFSAQ